MVGHGGRERGGRAVAPGAPTAVRIGAGIVLALLALLLTAGTASAQSAPTPPQPYGGQLDRMDPGDEVSSEQILEVGMLTLGTVNGLAFAVAMAASRMRGPTQAQTRRALINRTGAGTVSESRRSRRARERTAAPARPLPVGPSGLVPQDPPPGAVPEQGRPVPAEGLVPAARGSLRPAVRPGTAQVPLSPPTGVRSPVRR